MSSKDGLRLLRARVTTVAGGGHDRGRTRAHRSLVSYVYDDKGQRQYAPPGEPALIACGHCGSLISERGKHGHKRILQGEHGAPMRVGEQRPPGSGGGATNAPLLLIRPEWIEPRIAMVGVRGFNQQPDAVRKITHAEDGQLLDIRDRQRHRLAHQRFAVGWRTAGTRSPTATSTAGSTALHRIHHTQSTRSRR
jgi:hypothetical protein